MLFSIIKHQLLVSLKSPNSIIHPLIFFLITTSIFAINININNPQIAISIIWVCLTFAILLSSDQWQQDFQDGTFEQLILTGYVFEGIIFAKIIANWLANSLPLIVILPIIALLLKLDSSFTKNLLIVSIIATLIINFLVSFGSSLTLSANSTSSLLTILILPLLIPIIIFANSAFNGNSSSDFLVSIKFLCALLVFLVPVLTFASASAVRLNVVD